MVFYPKERGLTIGAWPVIIDEFVAYGKAKVESADKMMED